jgi:hypothetical protein
VISVASVKICQAGFIFFASNWRVWFFCFQPTADVIFVHNHPSGDTKPSAEDIALTGRLVEGR